MRIMLFVTALCTLAYGLWAHDWTLIVASFGLLLVWPIIAEGVEDSSRRRELDRLWDDDDLSGSA